MPIGKEILDLLDDESIAELAMLLSDPERLLDDRLPDDPLEFIRDVLGVKLWDGQEQIVESVAKNRFTTVETGHGVGKSFAAACIAVWFLSVHPDAILITTAPTANLVSNILWRHIRTLHRRAKKRLPGRVLETPRWEISSSWYGIGISPRRERKREHGALDFTALQGFHAPKLLAIIDEAGGVPEEIFETVESLVASEQSRLLVIGNPVGQSGPFYQTTRGGQYNHIRISCLDHPNVKFRRELIPGAVSYQWVLERFRKWGIPCKSDEPGAIQFAGKFWKPTPILMARVLGIPPEETEDKLVALQWLENAHNLEFQPGRPRVLAVDPAHGGGAQTAIVLREGKKIVGIWRRDFGRIEDIVRFTRGLAIRHDVDSVAVDGIGVGAGVVDGLRREGLRVIDVNFSKPARKRNRFANMRSELFWELREAIRKEELELPRDEMLDAEISVLRYDFDSQGRIWMPPKEGFEIDLGRSLDSVDALAMTFIRRETVVEEGEERRERLIELSQPSRWLVQAPKRRSRWRLA